MAKKRKKKNYRLRKSVRRTLGALFMISAIIIAAIPFPDAAAVQTVSDGNLTYESSLNYKVNADTTINKSINLVGDGNPDDDQKSYTIRLDGDAWIYEWQFKHFENPKDKTEAIISKYNGSYSVENIELQRNVNVGYIKIEQNAYEGYFQAGGEGTNPIELKMDDSDDQISLFKKYFPEKITELERLKDEYTTAKSEYDKDNTKPYPNPNLVKVEATPSTLSGALQSQYYCDYVLENTNHTKYLFGKGFAMTAVEEAIEGGGDTRFKVVYIPKAIGNDAKAPAGYSTDVNGFLYPSTTSYTLVGIGNNAFKGVSNVNTITLPDNVRYIGDSAFEGSFVQKIIINNVEEIGNYAFKSCALLKTVQIGNTTKIIGTEAFSDTSISTISIPYSVHTIGEGAFSKCKELSTIVFAEHYSEDVDIRKFAFFNCPDLANVSLKEIEIKKISEGAFALDSTTQETGSCTRFEFPAQISDEANLEDYILAGRANLMEVLMPSALGTNSSATIPPHTFEGCMNLSFVEFPDVNGSCGYIDFERTLFSQVTNAAFYVKGPALDKNKKVAMPRRSTWLCKMSGDKSVPYVYELNGEKIYEVSDGNYLQSINDEGILKACNFIDEDGNGIIQGDEVKPIPKLTIPGQIGNIQVTGIAEGCFTEQFLEKIEELEIADGGALKEIDSNVFAGANNMKKVYIGDSVETIGSETFKDCTALQSVEFGKNIKQIGDRAFQGCYYLTNVKFNEPDNPSDFPLSNIGEDAFSTNSEKGIATTKLVFTGTIHSTYGPFAWAMQKDNYVDKEKGVRVCYKTPAPSNLTVILDNKNGYATLVDYPRYSELAELYPEYPDLAQRYESGGLLTPAEESLVKATLNIIVPDGVESIDSGGYFNDSSKFVDDGDPYSPESNQYSITTYFENIKDEYYTVSANSTEKKERSAFTDDDDVEQITLETVKYLPEEVFENCSKLEVVQIGSAIEELERLPFLHCDNLSSVGFGNDKFICNNGIIYENHDDGSKTLLECLTSRGNAVGSSTVDKNNDADLIGVTKILPEAFMDCKYITAFDLTDVSSITAIPDSCFTGCEMLNTVDLPPEVRKIGDKAFATGGNYLAVTVRGREVGLGDDAFGNNYDGDRVKQPYLISYEDSAVRSDAKGQGVNVEKILGEMHTFKFYDETGLILLKTDYVEHGGKAKAPDDSVIPEVAGKEFVGWNKSLENIIEDDFTLAVYKELGGSGGNGGTGGGGNGGTGGTGGGTGVGGGIDTDGDGIPDVDADGNKLYKLTVTNGEGSGYFPAGKTVSIQAGVAPKGTTFANWSCSNDNLIFDDRTDWRTNLTMIASDVTVIANYTGQYTLEVEYGSGSGSYPAGAKVAISAVGAPQGRKFASWVTKTNGLNIENSKKESTIITMPASNAKVTATYMDTGYVSGGSSSSSKNNTSIVITKPGISDKDKASAYVSGSSDNFVVKISESLEAADEVQKALQKKYPDMSRIKYFAMDISLYDAKGVNKITNTEGLKVNITIPIPDALREYAGNNRVGAVVNGELEILNPKFTTISGVPSVTFTATHFSPYTVYVDTGNLTVTDTLDSTPKTGDGIHPKWFLSIGLACISIILFTKKDRRYTVKAYR